jgi:deoxyribodipyrimidine photolyase-related protein
MAEVAAEATHVPQHKKRLALFFSAMRHCRASHEARGRRVRYVTLDQPDNSGSLPGELIRAVDALSPSQLVLLQPGDYRVNGELNNAADLLGVPLEVRADRHFFDTFEAFDAFHDRRRSPQLEAYYRALRRRERVLMDGCGEPVGGRWNFDRDNRESFGKNGPGTLPSIAGCEPDAITNEVIALVERRFAHAPGSLENFDYPVDAAGARACLEDFIAHRLPTFGQFQDAMAAGHAYLYHSRLSSAMNLHLLDPREVVGLVEEAYRQGQAPLAAVEGFIRQVLGWREYVRGLYWRNMPQYLSFNALDADLDMPAFMWTGETDMACVADGVHHLVQYAYTHHIQRLMVLGLFAQLLGVRPYDVHRWHMSMYADAIDWVSAPNVIGMSQYADGGIVGSKPYCASGNYVKRMGNYCAGCRYRPEQATGDTACPLTTLYWDFLGRNEERLKGNHRMGFQLKNLARKDVGERHAIRARAQSLKVQFTADTYL